MPNVLFILLRRMKAPLIVLILAFAVSVLGFVLIPGVDDKGRPWAMSFMHAFYVVTYTASTIGFGELPYLFTDAQRMWATVVIFISVIAWMYAIGTLLALVQEPGMRALVRELAFRRAVRRIVEPFYLVCGYGDSGSLAVRGLSDVGRRAVVIDLDEKRHQVLAVEDLKQPVPGLCADAGRPDALLTAGLQNSYAVGLLALTDDDTVNLNITLTARLLRPDLPIIARAETWQAVSKLHAVGVDHILNPFDLFTRVLRHAIHAPSLYMLDELLTSAPHETTSKRVTPPRGHWILCGYGRFGQAIHRALRGEGITCTVIEENPELQQLVPDAILGHATDVNLLERVGVRSASTLVAGTDSDTTNLSLVLIARQLNPDIFVVARQNQGDNSPNFTAARIPLVLQRGRVLAGEVFSIVTAPLVVEFLAWAGQHDEAWASRLCGRIRKQVGDTNPERWILNVRTREAPAIAMMMADGKSVQLMEVCRDPAHRNEELQVIVLALKRGRELLPLPKPTEVLQKGDSILLCGTRAARWAMEHTVNNHNQFYYVTTGKQREDTWWTRWWHAENGVRKG